jgi:hypothetical protein
MHTSAALDRDRHAQLDLGRESTRLQHLVHNDQQHAVLADSPNHPAQKNS